MTPYYEQDGIVIYHGDCREVMASLPSIDLVVSDPPYGIDWIGSACHSGSIHTKMHRKQERVFGDAEPFDPAPLLGFKYVALFGAQHYASRLPDGGTFHVWDKRGEYKPFHTADFDTVWVNRKEAGRIFRCVWRGICREVEHTQQIDHPTQKPLLVMGWVLSMFPACQCIDPYMGSGTTLVAAKKMQRKAIGIEIEERYCEIAAKRLAQRVLPLEQPA